MIASLYVKSKKIFSRNSLSVGVAIALIMIASTSYNYFSSFPSVKSTDQAVWGQFGDYFGGVLNPLLSFMALVGLLFNLRSQQEESRKTALRHDEATFDTRLFQLLALSHSSVSAIKFYWPNGMTKTEYEGHRAVAFSLNRLQADFLYKVERRDPSEMFKVLLPEFNRWKKQYWSGVASYIESMLFLISYVFESGKGVNNIHFAIQAVFAQMSSDEKLLMFYVMIFSVDKKIHMADVLKKEFFAGASSDNLLPYREALFQSAVLERLKPNNHS
ncbi:hypothetical protein HFD98_24550 [Pseudomonas sp. EKM23D]|uniref:hypothetical protein n=1 Tax=unclassified Pseudomonas TaxID=196821 RepID=UPI00142E53EB|nr:MULTISPECIES: hypothetical protein [unclassified Pseudomonas]KAF6687211.1 hypothetical protein HFD98_24550 [Pseudomonas sp. EKM23D]